MIKQFNGAVASGFTWFARNRTRKQLLAMDDHALADFGLSRDALLCGNRAFPWSAGTDGRPVGVDVLPIAGAGQSPYLTARATTTANVLSLTLATAVLAPRTQQMRTAA